MLAPELAARKLTPAQFTRDPLPVLQALPEARRRELLQTTYAVDDAGMIGWKVKWPFKPPPVAGLRRRW